MGSIASVPGIINLNSVPPFLLYLKSTVATPKPEIKSLRKLTEVRTSKHYITCELTWHSSHPNMAYGTESEIEELQSTDVASCRQSVTKGKGTKRESAVWKYFQRIQSSGESCVECKATPIK